MNTANIQLDMKELDTIISMIDGEVKMRNEMVLEMIRDKETKYEDIEAMRNSRDTLQNIERKLKVVYDKHK